LVQGYAWCLDTRDWDGLQSVLSDDATANYDGYPIVGAKQWCPGSRVSSEAAGPPSTCSATTSHRRTATRGTCETRFGVLHLPADKTSGLMPYESVGSYHDELVRTPAGWRISHRFRGPDRDR
jgi:hypothetical protein